MRSKMRVENLCKSLGDDMVISKVNLTVEEGAIFGLFGHKGAGKTALLNMLGGVTHPDSGTIWIDEVKMADDWEGCKKKIGYLPDRIGFYENLTVRENLRFFADLFGLPIAVRESRMEALLKEVGLEKLADERVKGWNPSQIHRLGLAKTLLHDPTIVILDEPGQHLDLATKKIFWRLINRLAREGRTILLGSTGVEPIVNLCTIVGVLEEGELYVWEDANVFQHCLQREIHKTEIRICGAARADTIDLEAHSLTEPLTESEDELCGVLAQPLENIVADDTLQLSRDIQSHLIQSGLEIIDLWEGTIQTIGRLQATELATQLAEAGLVVEVEELEPTEEERLRYLCTRLQWDDEWGGGLPCER